jgi:hypothetical protein
VKAHTHTHTHTRIYIYIHKKIPLSVLLRKPTDLARHPDVRVGGHVGGEGVDGAAVVDDEEEDGEVLLLLWLLFVIGVCV